ncbi:MAG: 30S ribosomal protein S27ae [Candidatus Nanohaloarchaeota archaeon QJJ-7]|nr:30S ribosomal protein S27ae [Candidatus Nanohaloarchaeota archaeon QJJ-7]
MGKHESVELHEKYDEDGETDHPKCPRCGAFLAVHEDRKTCGDCGFSEIEK